MFKEAFGHLADRYGHAAAVLAGKLPQPMAGEMEDIELWYQHIAFKLDEP